MLVRTLFDSGAVSNFLSKELMDKIGFEPDKTTRYIKAVIGENYPAVNVL